MTSEKTYHVIISGGGTGGHIFPALAIANELKRRHGKVEILFVGAQGKMEMKKVPEQGYTIIGLWISGLQRKLSFANFLFPVKLISSYFKAARIIRDFKPHVVVGTGGYASAPTLFAAARLGVASVIQEQNSYAGLTNKMLVKTASKVCVAYMGMEKYFPSQKIVFTGNPVRKDIVHVHSKRKEAQEHFIFSESDRTVLVIGGSLGARTINNSILQNIDKLIDARVQIIWQTGKTYFNEIKQSIQNRNLRSIRIVPFLTEMDLAYAAADVVISRAGALAISELCLTKKPCILVPSPNVAEDHQTKNAMALVNEHAALIVEDSQAEKILVDEVLKLLYDNAMCNKLSSNIAKWAKPYATEEIVDEIEKLIQ